ncbi:TonB-dependent receptor [Pseudoalteromonas luteoviolacea]|uniref:TonB-dependent receptor n=1 Tax=Pseudoalteromonas luteoviolacea TaxID=43657 RepID=UPI001B38982F|nr:TonB-dependent receptor [Pseudoalteromonas luteoviolacea]MBQ4836680.1 TonB-dependent receptor [Pseudoalteromonas luteoviolacea]
MVNRVWVLLSGTLSLPILAGSDVDIETISVSGHNINLIGRSISASEGVVGQKEISVRPLARSGEIMELVPGMIATQHSGSGKALQYFLRGFSLDHGTDFATFVDGMPVNMRSHGHGQGYTDMNFVIPETISTLAYKKGAYYADVGDFSGAGGASLSTVAVLNQGVAEVTIGENEFRRLLLMDSLQVQGGNAILAFEGNNYRGPWLDVDEDVEKLNGLFKYTKSIKNGVMTLNFMAYDNQWNSADQIPARAVEQGILDPLGSLDKTLGGASDRYSFSANWENESWHASAFVIDYSLALWSNFTYFLDDADSGDQLEQVDERRIYGGHVSYELSSMLNNTLMFNTLGTQIRIDDIDEVGLYKTKQRHRLGTVRSDRIKESSASLYWDNKIDWFNNFSTVFGVRYDYFDFDVTDNAGENFYGHNLNVNSGKRNDDLTSLKASLIYDLSEQWQSYLSFGQGFHSNDARGTTIQIDPVSGDLVDTVDALVESSGYELGFRGFIDDKVNTSISFWALDLDSELLFVGDAGNTEPTDASTRKGVEATMYFRMSEWWSIDIEYAYTDAQYRNKNANEKYIPGTVKHVLQAGLNFEEGQHWFGSIRVRYFGERPLTEDNSVSSGSSTIWNMRIGYRFDDWVIKADILNLTDSRNHDITYFYQSQLANEAAPVDDVHHHAFEPRAIRISTSYQF